ncbi:hypothetical protein BGW42_002748 [Actinomortierella wolfii]|nr:hypothetical protein BGW42_002748 [Actinomortierella wolfii]
MLFFAAVSFFVNLITTAVLFLINIGDLHPAKFFSSFYFAKVVFTSPKGPDVNPLNTTYDFVTFGAFAYCQGASSEVESCSNAHINYAIDDIAVLNKIEDQYVSSAVRDFSKVTLLFIPTVCVAFLGLLLAATALHPKFRKRWLHVIVTLISILVALASFLLTLCIFTVYIARKIHYERHVSSLLGSDVASAKVYLGPALWMTLALLPWTAFGAIFGGFAVCCPGRMSRSSSPRGEVRVPAHTASEKKQDDPTATGLTNV